MICPKKGSDEDGKGQGRVSLGRDRLWLTHLCSTAISFSMLPSLPSRAFLAMHLMATSFWVLLSSARITSEKAPLQGEVFMRQGTGTPVSLHPLWVLWPPLDQGGRMRLSASFIHPLAPIRVVCALAPVIRSCDASQAIGTLQMWCSFLLSW